jgi:hypothetical protein
MRPCLLISWLFFLSSCAQSPVVDFIEDVPNDDGPALPEPEPTSEPEDEEQPADDADEVEVQTDPLVEDAGSSLADAGAPADASSSAATDAGRRDAGPTRPSLIPGLPPLPDLPTVIGSLSPPRTRACMKSADCTVSCFPLGAVACCRDDKTCGCSWAPGAYCL